ncbi:MAG: hypothetical protein KJ057_10105 [Phycisphaerae bacterium]|nr:MAG: hypothetical protein EDS66_05315 [Planctomycetota bacterium]KAB2949434.1 MAG: hypothetical protein F9K17_03065 [Phycisphaerae bacterium]MBE7458380.1 hypothetical protein [Planctomycetia bacterium]MCK6465194.1 hypothetical protein [Phycisphaerae bacterium]MCL4718811.1 hypothetical protein [Phycisphaerae bacterium]
MRGQSVIVGTVLAVSSWVGIAQSRGFAASSGIQTTPPSQPLAVKQDMIRDRVERFRDRMFRLQQDLAVEEPESAERLARALTRLGELGAPERLADLVGRLQRGEDLRSTTALQDEAVADLETVLAVLLQRDSRNEDREREIADLQAQMKRLEELLDRQRGLREATRDPSGEGLQQRVEEALRGAEEILNRQADLSAQTSQEAAAPGGMNAETARQQAQQQGKLAEAAAALAEAVEQAAAQARLGPPDPNESEEGERSDAAPQEESASSLLDQGAEAMKSAAEEMAQAAEALQEADGPQAKSEQKEAEEALRRAVHALKEAADERSPASSQEDLARQQRRLAEEADQLSQDMRPPQSGPSGESDRQMPSPNRQRPGSEAQPRIEDAEREMQDAAEDLEHEDQEGALEHQEKAVEALEQAKRELEDTLRQKRREEREEMLRDLEARFHDLYVKQKRINEETATLDASGVSAADRAFELALAGLSERERSLAGIVDTCLHILEEEGTTIVFPRILEQASEDMRLVADRLAQRQTGAVTQAVQAEILDALSQLLEAVRKMQEEERERQQQEDQGAPSDQNAPLLPTSAELKLLRAAQGRVRDRTVMIEKARSADPDADVTLERTLSQTADRQQECFEIARQLRKRLEEE